MTGYTKSMDYTSFKRYCKVLTLRDDRELIEKYKEVHKRGNTWPEIPRGIRDVGILDMEIYIHGTVLFMIMDTVPDFDHEKAMKKLAGLPRQAEWEEYVSKFQQAGEKGATPAAIAPSLSYSFPARRAKKLSAILAGEISLARR